MEYQQKVALLSSVLLFAMAASGASKLDTEAGFGGPDNTENTIAKDRAPRISLFDAEPLKAWKDWKQDLSDNTGQSFSLDYSALLLTGDGMTRDSGFNSRIVLILE